MEIINYQKRKNAELLKSLEEMDSLFLTEGQNYIPIYSKFFSLNDSNYNSINLNHKWFISKINGKEENNNVFNCKIKNINSNKVKDKNIFFKMAPLLDPYKYLIGKYPVDDEKIYIMPKLTSTEEDCNPKFIDPNNAAYVDGFFIYLTSMLNDTFNFMHGIEYYGSFLGVKNNFMLNIFDDLDYLSNSDFFNKNKNVLFKVDECDYLFQNEKPKLKPISIQYNTSMNSQLSVTSFNDELYEDVFNENKSSSYNDTLQVDLVELTEANLLENNLNSSNKSKNLSESNNQVTLKSNSTCSSRSSYTETDDENNSKNDIDKDDNSKNDKEDEEKDAEENDEDEWEDEDDDDDDDDDSDCSEIINATIPKFPVQVISMEYCENTFDNLILNENLKPEEWYSAFMQIIMMLITYQKAFNFTHNDLHTNNVMYNETDKKYLFYCYKKKYYKVPTFGRIFKIIDFGRSIYKFNNNLFCSDSFQIGGDAATQYNTEPYLNTLKPRLEPNYSFDLCRLACSIFDYIIDDIQEVRELEKCKDPIKRLVVEWCLDDKGINMLYKNNGDDRYPDFKLYKMIARCVHDHTPQAQLERPEFKAFSNFKGDIPADVIDIDKIPALI